MRSIWFAVVLTACAPRPQISDLAVFTQDFIAGIAFSATDRNEDLDGGTVHLEFGEYLAAIPIDSADPSVEREGTVVSFAYVYPACLVGQAVEVAVRVQDAHGGYSNELSVPVAPAGVAAQEAEPNDEFDDATVLDWPDEVAGVGFCGRLIDTGSSGGIYTEMDYFETRPPYVADVTVTLQAPIGSDFDLWAYDQYGDDEVARAEDAVVGQGFQYLSVTLPFNNGGKVYAMTAAGSGDIGDYSIYVDQLED